MVNFSKLKLYGFKSFVDKIEVEIGPGLNGIVGPNGCGKSNLVEALRWVMGEKSAKNMRGGGMEDVIFAGTAKRPARNAAEVAVIIDNQDGQAPAPFQNTTEIEIVRRIEKDKGSQYRVNGKAVRARDVNLLFADTMTGANSPALVSQGRITEIIVAKPQDRRRILEESAGISGLHSRRHEAELRLRAAEQNMTRLDDVLRDMRNRLASLKRQSRQAERYKELSAAIRQYDMALSWLGWVDARQKIKTEREAFATHNADVQALLDMSRTISADIKAQEDALPDLRKKDTELRAVLQNFRVSLERLEQDIQNKLKNLSEAEQAKEQLDKDNDFTRIQYDETLATIEQTREAVSAAERESLELPQQVEELEAGYQEARTACQNISAEKQNLETAMAVAEESRSQTDLRLKESRSRLDRITASLQQMAGQKNSADERIQDIRNNAAYTADLKESAQNLEIMDNDFNRRERDYDRLKSSFASLQQERDNLAAEIRGLESEKAALETIISSTANDDGITGKGLLQSLKVTEGYEKAVSAALDHWASKAGIDDQSAVYWSKDNKGNAVKTPAGCRPLREALSAPAALAAVIGGIGIAETKEQGDTLAKTLETGQMIVSPQGDIWRWDGLRVSARDYKAQDMAAVILEHGNRIASLGKSISGKQKALNDVETRLTAAAGDLDMQKAALNELGDQIGIEKRQFHEAERLQARLKDRMESLEREKNDLAGRENLLSGERSDLLAQIETLNAALARTDSEKLDGQRAVLASYTAELQDRQNRLDELQSGLTSCKNRLATAQSRIGSLNADLARLEKERDRLSARLEEFTERQDALDQKIADYKAAQNQDAEDSTRQSLLSKIAEQEKTVRDNGITLDMGEKSYRDLQAALRETEADAADAREKRALAQANVANAEEELNRLQSDMADRFDMTPQALEEQVLSLFNDDIPVHSALQAERDRAAQQRDTIGPVNLRAAIETQETEARLLEMEAEQNDLVKAIEQLRSGIARLNREARERLGIAFTRVDRHFQTLFTQLFSGGKAYLQMVESADPLESGLEIYAQPPGKALQTLSLLSGGEQTLTATALIFAMFLTNPSPICVLDEIDAPLDDANVDRVCSLMEKIAADTDTRFIVITHHRMTMARMDRLYGVTMSERGVSQLVSVDLAMQEELQLAQTA